MIPPQVLEEGASTSSRNSRPVFAAVEPLSWLAAWTPAGATRNKGVFRT